MLAPLFRIAAAEPPSLEEILAAIRAAASSTERVMPPLAAKRMTAQLNEVAEAVENRTFMWRMVLDRWLESIDEINAYAARARRHTEHEVFLAGTTPDDATYTEPAETRDIALAANGWLAGAGAAHREVTRLYGPWQIDRPANQTRETAA
jgi:hypothetical protein